MSLRLKVGATSKAREVRNQTGNHADSLSDVRLETCAVSFQTKRTQNICMLLLFKHWGFYLPPFAKANGPLTADRPTMHRKFLRISDIRELWAMKRILSLHSREGNFRTSSYIDSPHFNIRQWCNNISVIPPYSYSMMSLRLKVGASPGLAGRCNERSSRNQRSDREPCWFPFRRQNKHTLNIHILSYMVKHKKTRFPQE